MGYFAGLGLKENANLTGSNNVFIGYNAAPGVSSTTPLSNAIAIGANATVSASNSMVLGGTGTSAVNVGIDTATPGIVGSIASSGATLQITNASGAGQANLFLDGPIGALALLQDRGGVVNQRTFEIINLNGVTNLYSLNDSGTVSKNLISMNLNSGNVGIGTTTPGAGFQVNGTMSIFGGYQQAAYAPATYYVAPTDGFVVVYVSGIDGAGKHCNLLGNVDGVYRTGASWIASGTNGFRAYSFVMPVRKGEGWQIVVQSESAGNGLTKVISWVPFGN